MGLRKGEVVGLPWSAANLDRSELDIGWQLQRVRPGIRPNEWAELVPATP